MKIIFESTFSSSLIKILQYISKDKKSAAINFKLDIKEKIDFLKESPFMCKQSIYFENDRYRDLTFKGYTVIYKVDEDNIKILDIFKWMDR